MEYLIKTRNKKVIHDSQRFSANAHNAEASSVSLGRIHTSDDKIASEQHTKTKGSSLRSRTCHQQTQL